MYWSIEGVGETSCAGAGAATTSHVMNATIPPRSALARGLATTGAVAGALVALALPDGGAELTTRSVAAIFVWWTALLTIALSLWPAQRMPRAAVAAGGLLGGYAAFAGLSTLWAPSAERAFLEFDRVALLLGLFAIAVLAARRGTAARWTDGLAAGIAVVGVLALSQRLLPEVMPATDIPRLLPSAGTRLSYPVGYWNALSILLALGVPMLLRLAAAARPIGVRALALGVLPVLTGAMYLTSSRGGALALVVGAAAFLALTARRPAAVQAAALAAAGSVAAILVLRAHPALVDGVPGSAAAVDEGPRVAALVLGICVLCGVVHAAVARRVPPRIPLARPVLAGGAVAAVVAAAALLAAVDAPRQFREFKAPPDAAERASVGEEHLFSSSGSGRWQFWDAALEQFREHPVAGQGAGTFQAWWAEHGTVDWFVRNAHSLWLETLGELGLVGLLLLAGAFVAGLVAGTRRVRAREDPDERAAAAALVAVVAAFAAAAAIDWIWQIPAVAGVAVVALGLLVGPATLRPDPAGERSPLPFASRAALLLVAAGLLLAQALPLLVHTELDASRDAARRGDLREAEDRAASARAIQPWASSPHLQLALVREREGDLEAARRSSAEALERDRADWRLWVVEARLATKAGDVAAARAALLQARRLNPRSPALRSLGRP